MEQMTNTSPVPMDTFIAKVTLAGQPNILSHFESASASEARAIHSLRSLLMASDQISRFTRLFAGRFTESAQRVVIALGIKTAKSRITFHKIFVGERTAKMKQTSAGTERQQSALSTATQFLQKMLCGLSGLLFRAVCGHRAKPPKVLAFTLRLFATSLVVEAGNTLNNSLHGKGAWERNPWVWIIEFRKL